LIIVKLGGSVLTDKTKPFTIRYATLMNLISDIRKYINETKNAMIIVLGGGSFGHFIVSKCIEDKGFIDEYCASLTSNVMNELALHISRLFNISGLSTMVFTTHSIFTYDNYELKGDTKIINHYLKQQIVPILYGDVILYKGRFKVLSGDEISWYLASILNADKLIFVTDVDGVYDRHPRYPNARHLPLISLSKDLNKIRIETRGYDVTGGIIGKLKIGLRYHRGFEVLIINGLIKGNLYKALIGEKIKATKVIP